MDNKKDIMAKSALSDADREEVRRKENLRRERLALRRERHPTEKMREVAARKKLLREAFQAGYDQAVADMKEKENDG